MKKYIQIIIVCGVIVFAIVTIILTVDHYSRQVNESGIKRDTISYMQLPYEVKNIFINRRFSSNTGGIKRKYLNLDSAKYNISVSQTSTGPYADPVVVRINDKVNLNMYYNTPQPYIIYKNNLYHPNDYMVYDEISAEQSTFSRINIEKWIKR